MGTQAVVSEKRIARSEQRMAACLDRVAQYAHSDLHSERTACIIILISILLQM